MTRIIFSLFLLISLSARPASLIQQADSAYVADDFETACELYTRVLDTEGSSSQLYFNIGNTYYRLGNIGKAILNYKKALKLDPTNDEAKKNLDFVLTKTVDRRTDDISWSKKISRNILFFMTPNGWAVTALLLFIALLGCIGAYLLNSTAGIRKLSFFIGLLLIVIDTLVLIAAFKSAALAANDNEGIVISQAVQLSTVPRVPKDKSEQAFMLHEGAQVEIVDSVKVTTDSISVTWLEVKADDVHRAWIKAEDIERI